MFEKTYRSRRALLPNGHVPFLFELARHRTAGLPAIECLRNTLSARGVQRAFLKQTGSCGRTVTHFETTGYTSSSLELYSKPKACGAGILLIPSPNAQLQLDGSILDN